MHKPQTGIACPGCPHRATFVVVKDAVGRGRGRVFCGDAGCAAVGPLHPAATTCPGGEAALLPRYRQQVPTGDEDTPARVCAHFVTDRALLADDAAGSLDHLAREGETVLLVVLASSKASLAEGALATLADRARALGCADVRALDPFDTLASSGAVFEALDAPGVHALIFVSPCAQLMRDAFEPAEVNTFACMGCQRCNQITGCPALSFTPPTCTIDADACAGCDLCTDYCRTHTILSARQRLSPAERHAARIAAALGETVA